MIVVDLAKHVLRLAGWRTSPGELVISSSTLRVLVALSIVVDIISRVGLADVAFMRIAAHSVGKVFVSYLVMSGVLLLTRFGHRSNEAFASWLLVNLYCDLAFFVLRPFTQSEFGLTLVTLLFAIQISAFVQIMRMSADRRISVAIFSVVLLAFAIATYFKFIDHLFSI